MLQCVRWSTKPPRAPRVVVMVFSRNGFEQRLVHHHDGTQEIPAFWNAGISCVASKLLCLRAIMTTGAVPRLYQCRGGRGRIGGTYERERISNLTPQIDLDRRFVTYWLGHSITFNWVSEMKTHFHFRTKAERKIFLHGQFRLYDIFRRLKTSTTFGRWVPSHLQPFHGVSPGIEESELIATSLWRSEVRRCDLKHRE